MNYEKDNLHPQDDMPADDTAQPKAQGNTDTMQPFTTAFGTKATLADCQPQAAQQNTEVEHAEIPHAQSTLEEVAVPENPQTYGYQEAVNENMCTYHGTSMPEARYQTQQSSVQQEVPPVQEASQQQTAYTGNTYSSAGYRTYNQAPEKPMKKKRFGKGIWIGIGGIAAACFVFFAGTTLGLMFHGNGTPDETAAGKAWDNTLPTVQISTTPDYEPDNYDVVNGLAGEDIYAKVNPSIVSILATTSQGEASGSGVIMSENGYVITNQHVIDGAYQVAIQLSDGTQIEAKVIGQDAKTDLAVLKVDTDIALQAAEFGNSDELKPGEYAYAIGSPGGVALANTITGGRVSAINRDVTIEDRVMTLIQTDASINPGNSGGALINKFGQVVGITSAKLGISYYEGLGFAIPINSAKDIIDELIQTGYVTGRPAIGISGENIAEQKARYSNVPQGVLVRDVNTKSSAYQQGLQVRDIITAVDGQEITTMDEINELKENKKVGDTMELRVYRMTTGQFTEITITLMDEYELTEESSVEEVPTQGQNGYSTYGEEEDPFSSSFDR